MAISIDHITNEIFVPRADMTLIQSVPTEIRLLDTNQFRNDLRTLEASEESTIYSITHTHNTEVTVGGVTLARVIEIINGYTVTFEDGQYAVQLQGSNNNIADVTNVNQVSIRSANSAGLVTSAAIESNEYRQGVTIDENSTNVGTLYPVGTLRAPTPSVPNANIIADSRGFKIFYISGNYTFGAGDDISDKIVIGDNKILTTITVGAASDTLNTEIRNSTVTGTLDGNTLLNDCYLQNLDYVNGTCENCRLNPGTFRLGGNALVSLINCYSGVPGQATPTIDMNGLTNSETPDFIMRGYRGGVRFTELTGGGACSIDLDGGQVRIDLTTMTNGNMVIRGTGKVVDDATGELLNSGTYNTNFVLDVEVTSGIQICEVWQILGLDKTNPLTINEDGSITVGGITIDANTVGTTPNRSTTQTRQ